MRKRLSSFEYARFEEVLARCKQQTYSLADHELAAALVMFHACDEPLRTKLGLRSDLDTQYVLGLKEAVIHHGGFTWKQRKLARRMVCYGMTHLEVLRLRDERRRELSHLSDRR